MKDDLEFIDIDLDSDEIFNTTQKSATMNSHGTNSITSPIVIDAKRSEYDDNTDAYISDDDEDIIPEADSETAPDKDAKRRRKRISIIKEVTSYALVILAAFILASITNRYLIVNARIPTGSMIPTIMEGDRIIGNRIAYINSEPRRGDIIVFYYPDDETEKYVKRVIGLPGETVYIADGLVYIDGQALDESDYLTVTTAGVSGPFIVPDDSYFVMGDNRNSSWDSRFWNNTFVHKDKIIAKAEFCYYPSMHRIR